MKSKKSHCSVGVDHVDTGADTNLGMEVYSFFPANYAAGLNAIVRLGHFENHVWRSAFVSRGALL